jgi:hypothetical protein
MNEPRIDLGDIAAVVVVAGVVIMAFPSHALSIVQLAVVAVAVLACAHAFAINVPPAGWVDPFKAMSPFGRRSGTDASGPSADEIGTIQARLSGWRQPISHGPPLPREVLAQLRPLIKAALRLSPEEDRLASARSLLSPLTWAVLVSDPEGQPPRFLPYPPNRKETARAVHHVLDEIERISSGALPGVSIDSSPSGAS